MTFIPPVPQFRILASSAVAIPHTGVTAETVLAIVPIPARAMGLNGMLRILLLWSYTNGADDKFLRVRLGGLAGSIYFNTGALTTSASLHHQLEIQNRGAANSQIGQVSSVAGQWAASTAAPVTTAIDTSAAVDLVFTGQLENITDTITLERYSVELLLP